MRLAPCKTDQLYNPQKWPSYDDNPSLVDQAIQGSKLTQLKTANTTQQTTGLRLRRGTKPQAVQTRTTRRSNDVSRAVLATLKAFALCNGDSAMHTNPRYSSLGKNVSSGAYKRHSPQSQRSPLRLSMAVMALVSVFATSAAPATSVHNTNMDFQPVSTKAKAKSKRSQQIRITPMQNNSAETSAQRDRRLYRECRGLPNSGACAGYTYGPSGRK